MLTLFEDDKNMIGYTRFDRLDFDEYVTNIAFVAGTVSIDEKGSVVRIRVDESERSNLMEQETLGVYVPSTRFTRKYLRNMKLSTLDIVFSEAQIVASMEAFLTIDIEMVSNRVMGVEFFFRADIPSYGSVGDWLYYHDVMKEIDEITQMYK